MTFTIHVELAVRSPDYSRIDDPHLTAYDYKSQRALLDEIKAYKDIGAS